MSHRTVLIAGVSASLIGLATYAVVLATAVIWPATLGTVAIMTGLVIMGSVLAPTWATFKAGLKIWQNDGLP